MMKNNSYTQTMQYNPLVRWNQWNGRRERDAECRVRELLEREYGEVEYEPYGMLPEELVRRLDLFAKWNVASGDRRASVASMGNYFDFCNIEIRNQVLPAFGRVVAAGCLLVTTLPTAIPGQTRIFSDSPATRMNYHNEPIAVKRDGFTIYSTAPDKDLFHYVDAEYLLRLRQMCDKLGADVALLIEGNKLIALFNGARELFHIEGADAKKRERDARTDIHTLLYMRMMTYPFCIWDELGYCA